MEQCRARQAVDLRAFEILVPRLSRRTVVRRDLLRITFSPFVAASEYAILETPRVLLDSPQLPAA